MPLPTYLELAEQLADRLDVVGDRVPSEHELCAAHRVSRPTARAALQELERRFLVRRVRGAGTFVSRRIDYVISPDRPPSATAAFHSAGVETERKVLSARTVRPPADVAEHLGLGRDARVVSIRRRMAIGGLIASITNAYVPADLFPGLSRRLGDDVSLFELFRDGYGIEPRRRWSRASLEVPTTAVALELELEGRPPAWLLEGVNENRVDGSAVEFTRSWSRADLISVVFEMGAR